MQAFPHTIILFDNLAACDRLAAICITARADGRPHRKRRIIMLLVYGLRRPVTLGQTTSKLSRNLVERVLAASLLPEWGAYVVTWRQRKALVAAASPISGPTAACRSAELVRNLDAWFLRRLRVPSRESQAGARRTSIASQNSNAEKLEIELKRKSLCSGTLFPSFFCDRRDYLQK